MKASDLRLGNIVGVCDEATPIPSEVIVLEPDVVHLSNRKNPDSDRDIVGIRLDEKWLAHFKFNYNGSLENWIYQEITIWKITTAKKTSWEIESKAVSLKISFVHELQNLLHIMKLSN